MVKNVSERIQVVFDAILASFTTGKIALQQSQKTAARVNCGSGCAGDEVFGSALYLDQSTIESP
jgi:hypothetical protein